MTDQRETDEGDAGAPPSTEAVQGSSSASRKEVEPGANNAPGNPVNLPLARAYAKAGLPVFTISPDTKQPNQRGNWREYSTTDIPKIEAMFARRPSSLVAIDIGKAGLVVIDCDRHGKGDGVANFKDLIDQLGIDVAGVPKVRTPSGGVHLIFAQPEDAASTGIITNRRGGMPDAIDVRGMGGYASASGNKLPNGREYRPLDGCPDLLEAYRSGDIPPLPAPLAGVLRAKGKTETPSAPASASAPANRDSAASRAERTHARGALELFCEELASTQPGERNTKTNDVAFVLGRMVAVGWIDRTVVEKRILAACEANGSIKDDGADKVRGTIASGLNAGTKSPHPPLAGNASSAGALSFVDMAARLAATPYTAVDPSTLPVRQWIYNNHYIGRFVSATIAPGGVGKSSLSIVEALSIVTGLSLLGIKPQKSVRVWIWNGEDPPDELKRRVAAVAKRYGIDPSKYEGRLFLDSGRINPMVLVDQQKNGTHIIQLFVDRLIVLIKERGIGLLIIDPFVASHRVTENDNNAINLVAQIWSQIAEATGCAIELVHHARKTGGAEIAVEDGRGASALIAAARSVRVLNPMSEADATKGGVDPDERRSYFRVDNGKANLAPPAEKSEWYKIVSVPLGNGPDEMNPDGSGDFVGVVTPWEFIVEELSLTKEQEAFVADKLAAYPHNYNATGKPWAGTVIAKALGREDDEKKMKAALKAVLDDMIARGQLEKSQERDPRDRKMKTFVRPNKAKVAM
ncbi:Prim_Pol domain containing protein [Rhabdaerophilaceae bacterium]